MAVVTINAIEFPSKKLEFENLKTRVCSAKERVNLNTRPKSSPLKLHPDALEKFYVPPVRSVQTAQMRNRDDRGCGRYHLPSSPLHKQRQNNRSDQSPESKNLPEIYNIGPGYVITRSGGEFDIKIDSESFFGSHKHQERSKATKKHQEDQKDILINQLQEQISNLTVQLAEEKMNHQISIEKWKNHLDKSLEMQQKDFNYLLESTNRKHEETVQLLKEEHALEMENIEINLTKEKDEITKELDTFKASFEVFRQSFIKETEEKFEKQRIEMSDSHNKILLTGLEKQKRELSINFEMDLERLKEEHKSEISLCNDRHKSEIDRLNRRYEDAADMEEKLSQTIQELAKVRREFSRVQDECDSIRDAHNGTRRQLAVVNNENEELKEELAEFNERFEERVQRLDDSYKQKMDTLQNQIVEMRRAYVQKCEELVEARKEGESHLQGKIETAKDVMKEIIHSRRRARISLVSSTSPTLMHHQSGYEDNLHSHRSSLTLAGLIGGSPGSIQASLLSHHDSSGDPEIHKESRPSSAPTTDLDQHHALLKSHKFNHE